MFRKRLVFGFVISRGVVFNLFNIYISLSLVYSRVGLHCERESVFGTLAQATECDPRARMRLGGVLVLPMTTVRPPHRRRRTKGSSSGVVEATSGTRKRGRRARIRLGGREWRSTEGNG